MGECGWGRECVGHGTVMACCFHEHETMCFDNFAIDTHLCECSTFEFERLSNAPSTLIRLTDILHKFIP
jgi:hypothetical protein